MIGLSSASSAAANTAAAAGLASARLRPIPTDWDPWPGKTYAVVVIELLWLGTSARGRATRLAVPESTAAAPLHAGGVCKLACIPMAPYAPGMAADPNPTRPAVRPSVRPVRRTTPRRTIARTFEAALSAPVLAAGTSIQNPRQISERVAMGRALWRELVVGFAWQLGELRLGFTQLAALYVLADSGTTTVADLADALGRSPSATSRLVDGLVRRRLVERRREEEDRRQRSLWLTPRGHALLRLVDRGRADQFLSAVRPLPPAERKLIAMGVAALATGAISRRGRLIKAPRE